VERAVPRSFPVGFANSGGGLEVLGDEAPAGRRFQRVSARNFDCAANRQIQRPVLTSLGPASTRLDL
jgi:hypothetical protein